MTKHIAYMGWLGHKNIGDEACYEYIRSLFPKDYQFTTYDGHAWTKPTLPDLVILGGGTLLDVRLDRRGKALLAMQAQKRPVVVWGSGVMPLTAPKRPQRSVMDPRAKALLERAAFVGVRGPISQRNLLQTGYPKAKVIGDPALCLSTPTAPLGKASKKIAINIGDTHTNLFGSEAFVAEQAKVLVRLVKKAGFEPVLFSVWPADVKFLTLAHEPGVSTIRPFDESTPALMDFFKTCYCVIGEKLHASVLSAAAGVPFISIAYREKNFDFAESLTLGDWAVRSDKQNLAEVIMQKLTGLPEFYDEYVRRIEFYKGVYTARHTELRNLALEVLR